MNLYSIRQQLTCFSFIIVLKLAFTLNAQPRDIKFRHLTIEHGLSQNSANCIVQDNNGFIWIGTQVGMNR